MQRSQRGLDNPALDIAVEAANALRKPLVVFLAPMPAYPNSNLRHYCFLNEGIPDIAATLAKRNIGFVLRRFPDAPGAGLRGRCREKNEHRDGQGEGAGHGWKLRMVAPLTTPQPRGL